MHKKEALRYEIEQDAAFMAVILFDSNKHLCMLIFNSQGNDINISALSQFFFQFEKTVVEVDPLWSCKRSFILILFPCALIF